MSAGSNKADMIDLMIEHELAASYLYKVFALMFQPKGNPGENLENPWEEMVQEEKAHADVLKTLRGSLDRLVLTRSHVTFPANTIMANLDFIRKETTIAQGEPMSQLRALSVCLSIEQSALEHEFYTVFTPVSDAMKDEFRALSVHTTDHVQRIEECLVQEHARLAEEDSAARLARVGSFRRRFNFLAS